MSRGHLQDCVLLPCLSLRWALCRPLWGSMCPALYMAGTSFLMVADGHSFPGALGREGCHPPSVHINSSFCLPAFSRLVSPTGMSHSFSSYLSSGGGHVNWTTNFTNTLSFLSPRGSCQLPDLLFHLREAFYLCSGDHTTHRQPFDVGMPVSSTRWSVLMKTAIWRTWVWQPGRPRLDSHHD